MKGPDRRPIFDAFASDLHAVTRNHRLAKAGLIDAAKIVRAAAVQAATRAGVKIKAIMADDDRIRQKAYLAAAYRRGTITIDNMVVAGVDPEVTAFAAKARK